MPLKLSMLGLAAFFAMSPLVVHAHSLGVSLEKVVGAYLVDIGYDPIELNDGSSSIFDFAIREVATNDYQKFDHVWVRIIKEGTSVLATGVAQQEFGPTTLMYRFPGAGEYELNVSYRTSEGETIATTFFPLVVKNSDTGLGMRAYILAAIGIVGAAAVAWYMLRRRSRQSLV